MMLRAQCEHGRWDAHGMSGKAPNRCDGGRNIDIDVDVLRTAMHPVVANRKYMDEANAARLAVCRALMDAVTR